MNLKKIFKTKIIIVVVILVVFLVIFGLYQIYYLRLAHSTFDNYYKFRGCAELVEKTDTYGLCKLSSGQTIIIVKYDNRWFLDGDLPCGFFCL